MSTHYAVAERWDGGQFVLTVHDAGDDHEVFGDWPTAASPDDMPAAAEARLAQAGWLRIVGQWRRDGDRWVADAEIVVS